MIRPAVCNPIGAVRYRVGCEPGNSLPWVVYRLDWCGFGRANPGGKRGVWGHVLVSRHATEQAAEAAARELLSPVENWP